MILEKVVIGIAIFVSYFFQTSVDFFALGKIKPDFLLILALYFGLYKGSFTALWIGFWGGLLQDINLGGFMNLAKNEIQFYIGTSALPKTLLGYLAGKFSHNINKEATMLVVIVVFVASLSKGIITFFIVAIFHQGVQPQAIIRIVLPEALYTAALSVVWFRILRWAFPIVEKTSENEVIRRFK